MIYAYMYSTTDFNMQDFHQQRITKELSIHRAAELMTQTGDVVNLKVAKQGAIYHGLATLLNEPSPTVQRRQLPTLLPSCYNPLEFVALGMKRGRETFIEKRERGKGGGGEEEERERVCEREKEYVCA